MINYDFVTYSSKTNPSITSLKVPPQIQFPIVLVPSPSQIALRRLSMTPFAGLSITPRLAPNSLPRMASSHGTSWWYSSLRQFAASMTASKACPIFLITRAWITLLIIFRVIVALEFARPEPLTISTAIWKSWDTNLMKKKKKRRKKIWTLKHTRIFLNWIFYIFIIYVKSFSRVFLLIELHRSYGEFYQSCY